MSIIEGVLAGLGDGAMQIAAQNNARWNAEDSDARKLAAEQQLTQQRADLEEQKAKNLAQFNSSLAAQQRSEMVSGNAAVKQSIIQDIIAKKANAANDYTDEQGNSSPASYDELQDEDIANAAYQPTKQELAAADKQAGVQTGYISPLENVKTNDSEAVAEMKARAASDKLELTNALTQLKYQTLSDNNKNNNDTKMLLAALKGGNGEGKTPANVATAQWLADNYKDDKGNPISMSDAWDMVSSGKSKDPVEMQVRTASMILGNNPRINPADAFLQAGKLLDSAISAPTAPSSPKGPLKYDPATGTFK